MMLEAILRKYTLKPITTTDAPLKEVLRDELDVWGIRDAIERKVVHRIISDATAASWQTVSDIYRTVENMKEAA